METNNKLREAVEQIRDIVMDGGFDGKSPAYIVNICDAALAEPVKNCEVGTVEEQTKRFETFCQSNMQFYKDMFGHDDEGRLDGWDCREDCPVGRMIDSGTAFADHCQLAWAQMPYEEGGGK